MALDVNADLFASPLFYLALLPVLYLLRRPLLSLLTPRGVAGIPALPNPSPLTGDIPWLAHIGKTVQGLSFLLDEVAKEVGPICQIRISFLRTLVVVTDYQEVESILSVRHAEFDRGENTARIFRHLLPTGQISQKTNPMWKHHRRIIGPAMTSKHLNLTTPRANEAVKGLIELFRLKAEKAGGRSFASEADMESATMDAICGMAFGGSWGIIDGFTEQIKQVSSVPTGPLGEAVFKTTRPDIADSTWYLFESIPLAATFPAVNHFFQSLSPTFRKHNKRVQSYLQARLVESRKKNKLIGAESAVELADNTLDMMVAREFRAEDWMPDNEMLDEVLQYLVAGTETSGVTLTWWLKYMTNHPSVQRKLRDHILKRMPELEDRQPNFEDLNAANLPYLEAVVHETLRLSRTAGGYVREANRDTIVLGHRIPKGTTLVFTTANGLEDAANPLAAPYSPTSSDSQEKQSHSGSDALIRQTELLASERGESAKQRKVGYWAAGTGQTFDPERWLNDKGEFDANAGPSLPFSLGQRGCFGKNLAVSSVPPAESDVMLIRKLLELRLFMAQLNLAFFFGAIPDEQNSNDIFQTVATHPKQSFIRPLSWSSEEAQAV